MFRADHEPAERERGVVQQSRGGLLAGSKSDRLDLKPGVCIDDTIEVAVDFYVHRPAADAGEGIGQDA